MSGSKLRELTEETDDFEVQIAKVSFPKLKLKSATEKKREKTEDRKSDKAQNATLALADNPLQRPQNVGDPHLYF